MEEIEILEALGGLSPKAIITLTREVYTWDSPEVGLRRDIHDNEHHHVFL